MVASPSLRTVWAAPAALVRPPAAPWPSMVPVVVQLSTPSAASSALALALALAAALLASLPLGLVQLLVAVPWALQEQTEAAASAIAPCLLLKLEKSLQEVQHLRRPMLAVGAGVVWGVLLAAIHQSQVSLPRMRQCAHCHAATLSSLLEYQRPMSD